MYEHLSIKLSKAGLFSWEKDFKDFKSCKGGEWDYYGTFTYFISHAFLKYLNTNELRYPKTWILSKVEDSWKTTEFVVLPHRDTKDVFILGGTDDIQVGNWVIENLWWRFWPELVLNLLWEIMMEKWNMSY